jgi:hypothetical protein
MNIEYNNETNPINISIAPYSTLCMKEIIPETNKKTLMDTANGHGLLSKI